MFWTDLIHLNPDDDSSTFYKKMLCIQANKLEKDIERFEKYEKYLNLLKFHQATLKRPEQNIRLTYNNKYGWHTSSCVKSLPEKRYKHPCTCEEDFTCSDCFFYRVEKEKSIYRCKLCKMYFPSWETDPPCKEV